MAKILPISSIVATADRCESLSRMLDSLALQDAQPSEMIIVDASKDNKTQALCNSGVSNLKTNLRYFRATEKGAGVQRNQAVSHLLYEYIMFADDDVLYEPECVSRLWTGLQSSQYLGGVSAMIVNQKYESPGYASSILFRIMNGQKVFSYAGKCIGPAMNMLPEDRDNLPEIVPVEWLNLGCTLYRKEALPIPPFMDHFVGYSLQEDLALSLTVGKQWQLANVRTARIYHDSQPGDHKSNPFELAKMELINRHYVMTKVLERTSISDYAKLALLQIFQIASTLASRQHRKNIVELVLGKAWAIVEIWKTTRQ